MKHEKTIEISFNELLAWQEFLTKDGGDSDEVVKTFTADFGDCGEGNVFADIKICDVLDGVPFIDAVMFQDGSDVGCLEVRDIIAGEYIFANALKDTYVVVIPDTIEAAKEGQKKYRAVEKWLHKLNEDTLATIDKMIKTDCYDFGTVDKIPAEDSIESILHCCENYEDALQNLFEKSERSGWENIEFNADNNSPQCFTDKRDWYVLSIHDLYNGKLSRKYDTKNDAQTVVDKLMMDKDNYDVAYTIISVPFGATVTLWPQRVKTDNL